MKRIPRLPDNRVTIHFYRGDFFPYHCGTITDTARACAAFIHNARRRGLKLRRVKGCPRVLFIKAA